MARKGNPISVRLGLNRSSDSSRFKRIWVLLFFLLTFYYFFLHFDWFFWSKGLFMILGCGINVLLQRLGWPFPSFIILYMTGAPGDAPVDLNQPDAAATEHHGDAPADLNQPDAAATEHHGDEEIRRRQEEELLRLRGDLIHRAKIKLERAEELVERAYAFQWYSSRKRRAKSNRLYRACVLLRKREAFLRKKNAALKRRIMQHIFGDDSDGP
uniref:Uncharacterized protein n=1 Tax=Bougainvillea spectabilis TaxID=146096 RepID=A0A7T1T1X9_9CARY|nr:hypothetical protein KQ602_mgp28 [Bougainvillea spectabilis]QPP04896.1 hypothetical protein [Bougainvillea spectabilis]